MDEVVRVARAGADDWQAVRDIRLAALRDAPFAFGSTLERELAFDDREWQRRVNDDNWFLAWFGQQPVGVVAGFQEAGRPDERHLVAIWVTAEHRGTSVSAEFVEAICDWTELQGASVLTLWVADGNPRARRFYDRLGFITTGRRQPPPSAPEVGEELLQRYVNARKASRRRPCLNWTRRSSPSTGTATTKSSDWSAHHTASSSSAARSSCSAATYRLRHPSWTWAAEQGYTPAGSPETATTSASSTLFRST